MWLQCYAAPVSYLELSGSTSFRWGTIRRISLHVWCLHVPLQLPKFLWVLESFWYKKEAPGNDLQWSFTGTSSSVEIQSLEWPTRILQRSFNPIQGMVSPSRRLVMIISLITKVVAAFPRSIWITYHTSCLRLIRWFSSSRMVDR